MTFQILEQLDCHDIKEYTTEWRCALPQKQNKTAVCIKKENLSASIRTSEGNTNGDIFIIVMTIKNIHFGEANKWIHKILGLKYEFKSKKQEADVDDPLFIFKKVKKHRCIVNQDMPVYDDGILKEYIKLPWIDWIREGIMPFTCDRFNIGYSYDHKRVVIPERKWDGGDDEYVGIMGRTTIPMYDMLDIPKYFPLKKFSKGLNVYGVNENYKSILEAGYCVVFESQKSPLKRYSRKDETGVSIGNCEITEEQTKILISLGTEICICLDEGITLDHIRNECEKFYKIRPVSYIYDKWGLLTKGSKDSPADLPDKQYKFMFKHRIQYDETEHKKHLKEVNKK